MIESAENKIADNVIIAEAIRLVSENVQVTFPVNGRSMLPFIVGGRESVVLQKPELLNVYDVVLAKVETGNFVIHRIEKIEGGRVTLMGDGNLLQREFCTRENVFAIASHVVNIKGKKRPLNSGLLRIAAICWVKFLPFRKYLLKVYRLVARLK